MSMYILRAFITALLVVAGTVASAHSFETTSAFYFGPIGIVKGDTVRLYVADVTQDGDRSCPLDLGLYSDSGVEVATSTPEVRPGQTVFLDFLPTDLRKQQRNPIRAAVNISDCAGFRLVATVEVFDRRGRTKLVLHPLLPLVPPNDP